MSNILSPVQVQDAVQVESFGEGGQQYIADIWGGINVSAEQVNPLFSFRATDSNVANAAQLRSAAQWPLRSCSLVSAWCRSKAKL